MFRSVLRWPWLLVLAPLLGEWVETGSLPHGLREWTSEGLLMIVIGVCIRLILVKSDRLQRLADNDPLTGLLNGRRFQYDLNRVARLCARRHTGLALFHADLDRFKQVNDTWGHPVGDALLRAVATQLSSVAGEEHGTAYRVGGDEFAVIFPECPPQKAMAILERLKAQLASDPAGPTRYGSAVSIGAVQLAPGETYDAFYKRADLAMYTEKRRNETRLPPRSPAVSDAASEKPA